MNILYLNMINVTKEFQKTLFINFIAVFTLSLAAKESPITVGVRVYCVSSSSIDVPSRLSKDGSSLLKITHYDHYKLFLVVSLAAFKHTVCTCTS